MPTQIVICRDCKTKLRRRPRSGVLPKRCEACMWKRPPGLGRRRVTRCPAGHKYTRANTYFTQNGSPGHVLKSRACRICQGRMQRLSDLRREKPPGPDKLAKAKAAFSMAVAAQGS